MKRIILAALFASALTYAQTGPFRIATIAGSPYDPSGDGGSATLAGINLEGVAFRAGNLYLTDGSRIRKIAPNGNITTVVGLLDPVVHQPIAGFSGDGGPALGAQLGFAVSLVFDSAGNVYIADSANSCVRKVTARVVGGVAQPLDGSEIITTVVGICTVSGNSNGNGAPTSATLNSPRDIAVDPVTGTLYIADQNNNNIRKVDSSGMITTFAGTGVAGFQDGPAATARFNFPTGVAVDSNTGDVYIADQLNSRLRRISAGQVTTAAGTGTSSASGNLNEGGAAIAANVRPVKVRFANGILYIVDSGIGMIRQINSITGIITTIAGAGLPSYAGAFPPVGDGGPALAALLGSGPGGVQDVALDAADDFFITDASSHRLRFAANTAAPATIFGQIVSAGNIATIAGPQNTVTFNGDAGPALAARLFGPGSIVFDPAGSLYFTDAGNNRVRRIDSGKTITTVAGNGIAAFSGVPGPATAAEIQPGSLALNFGNLYLTNNSTRVLQDAANFLTISTDATGVSTPPSPDGTPALQARMGAAAIVFDLMGNLYIGDNLNNRVWKVDTNGIVRTVAGGGAVILNGIDVLSAQATQAQLFGPGSLALDPGGNLYLTDGLKSRILKVTAHGTNQPLDGTETITIFAGGGNVGFFGDGGPAAAAFLNGPRGLTFDTAGNLYFNDAANFRVRKVDKNGMVNTVAGTGVASYTGDGGPALSAQIRGGPLAFDGFGNLFMSDSVNQVIRVLDNTPPTLTFSAPLPAANANGWNNTSVNIPFTASDTGAGLASTSTPSPLQLSSEGLSVSGLVMATDRAGNSAGFNSPVVKIDKTPPTLDAVVSPNPVPQNAVATVISGAADTLSGLASQSCGAVVTTTLGTQMVNCTATDVAGNTAAMAASYVVLPTVIVSSGMCAPFPVTLAAPAGPNGVLITLTSNDATLVNFQPGVNPAFVSIPVGATVPRRTAEVCGLNPGTALVTASGGTVTAPQVLVQVINLLLWPSNDVQVTTARPLRLELDLSSTAPAGGLTVNLTSDNPGVASVLPTVFFAANTTSAFVAVTGIAAGSTSIHASVPPYVPAILSVTVP